MKSRFEQKLKKHYETTLEKECPHGSSFPPVVSHMNKSRKKYYTGLRIAGLATSCAVVVIAGAVLFTSIMPRLSANKNSGELSASIQPKDVDGLNDTRQKEGAVAATTAETASADMHLPSMPAEPQILDYNHKLYITNSVFTDKTTAAPQDLIGYIKYNSIDVPAYTVIGENITESICILKTYIQSPEAENIYFKYKYLCDDDFTAQGKSYGLMGGILNVTASSGNSADSNESNMSDYSLEWIFLTSYPSVLQNIKEILGDEIGKIPSGGSVYSIDEIDPSEAVYINIGDNWFLVTKTNEYTGKTVDDVMKDKGITYSGPVY